MSIDNNRILSHSISYQELKSIHGLKITGIYKIENLINHKVYIGQSEDIIKRLKCHSTQVTNEHLHNSICKYSLDNFSFEILKITYDLNYWEIFLIQIYHATDDRYGYNVATGGEGGNLGPEVNKRISESLRKSEKYKQSLKSPERSAKISYAAKHRTPETLYAMGSANRGKKISDEIKQKMSIAQKNSLRKYELMHSENYRKKCRETKLGTKNPNYGKHLSEEEKRIRSEKLKGRPGHPQSKETREYLSIINKGKTIPEEVRMKISKALKGRKQTEEKIKAHKLFWTDEMKQQVSKRFKGIPKSEETKRKMSESAKRRYINGNPNFEQAMMNRRGEHHYNNGVINICAKECPPGFVPGMLKKN